MLAKVETTKVKKLVDVVEVDRVVLNLSADEASMMKLALEHLRHPGSWAYERDDMLETLDVNKLIETLEVAQIYVDGVFVD